MTIAKTIKTLGVVAATYMVMTGTAYAVADYCSSNPKAAGFDPNLVVGNLTLNNMAAKDCYGHVDLGNQDTSTIASFANSSTLSLWDQASAGEWDFLLRDEGDDAVVVYEGIRFTLSAPQGAKTDATWTLDLFDTNGNTPENIPLTLDFLVFIKGGTEGDFFYFDDRILLEDNTGKFTMTFVQNNGNNGSVQGLSGFSLLVRDLRSDDYEDPNEDPNETPVPHTLALFGLGLLAAGAMRRRRTVRG